MVNLANDSWLKSDIRKYNFRSLHRTIYRDNMNYSQPRFNFMTNRVTTWKKSPKDIINQNSMNTGFKEKLEVWI